MMKSSAIFICLLSGCAIAVSEEPAAVLHVTQSAEGPVSQSVEREADVAIARGVRWLAAQQQPIGGWGDTNDLSLSAVSLLALVHGGCTDGNAIRRAARFLADRAREDGAFRATTGEPDAAGAAVVCDTAWCATALHAAGDPASAPLIRSARRYLADSASRLDDESALRMVIEALRQTASVEDNNPDNRTRLDFDGTVAAGRSARLLDHPASALHPDESLLLLLLTGVHRDDPRIRAALQSILPLDSPRSDFDRSRPDLYAALLTRTKALSAFGCDTLVDRDGRRVNWREETILALIGIQKIEPGTGLGFWDIQAVNPENTDPIRSTACAILTLRAARRTQQE